jgi:hypothetical protein
MGKAKLLCPEGSDQFVKTHRAHIRDGLLGVHRTGAGGGEGTMHLGFIDRGGHEDGLGHCAVICGLGLMGLAR